MQIIKNAYAKVKPFAKGAAYTAGALAVGGGAWLAYQALKGAGADAAAAVVGDAAGAVADAASTAVGQLCAAK